MFVTRSISSLHNINVIINVSNKEGLSLCRPALVMHSFLISFSGLGRQECRPSLSCYINEHAIKMS